MSHRMGPLSTLALAALGAFCLAQPLTAQATCNVNFRASCVVGGTAAGGMTVSIPTVVRLQMPNAVVALGAATAADFTAGFGTALSVPLTIKANRSWTVTLGSPATTWTATGPSARLTKPRSDLQWGLSAAGAFTDLAATMTTISTGGATGGQLIALHVRSKYAWALDTPGSYSLPLQLTITAP